LIGGDEAHFIDGMPIPGRVQGKTYLENLVLVFIELVYYFRP
jgi:hypothetical protein